MDERTILGIDCSGGMTSVGLGTASGGGGEYTLFLGRRQSSVLQNMVEEMLRMGGVAFSDLSAIAVTRGPGYFSGIRVGMSYALSLAFARKLPVIPLSSPEVLAYGGAAEGLPVAALLPSARGSCFCGVYLMEEDSFRSLDEEKALPLKEIPSYLSSFTENSPVLCVADRSCGELPDFTGTRIHLRRDCLRGEKLVALARQKEEKDPLTVHPRYMRKTW